MDVIAENVSISAPSRALLVDTTVRLVAGHRYGLLGPNGRYVAVPFVVLTKGGKRFRFILPALQGQNNAAEVPSDPENPTPRRHGRATGGAGSAGPGGLGG